MRIDPAAWPFAAGLLAATLLAAWWSYGLAAVPAVLLLFTLNFFRDPERRVPSGAGLLVSPADGRIIRADPTRVSIFMNVFDVHVCRTPSEGRVREVRHTSGKFVAAFKDEASDHNERTTIVVDPPEGPAVTFTLVAGLVARRIVCRTSPGVAVARGDRIGIIRFGSRVDVDLPGGSTPAVAIGDRVTAGETVIAHRGA